MTPKDLINEMETFFITHNIEYYKEYTTQMPIQLKRFDDDNAIWCKLPIRIEEISDDEKTKTKPLFMKFAFSYGFRGINYSYSYNIGGGSGTYNYKSVEDYFKSCIRCHHIDYEIKENPQRSIFDFI